MFAVNLSNLNPLEREIHSRLSEALKASPALSITEAAAVCGCSASKISKYIKKLGFANYKQFKKYLAGETVTDKPVSSEAVRIRQFLDTFDASLIDRFISYIDKYDKILILGFGPSHHCADYLEMRLRLIADKNAVSVPNASEAEILADSNTLLVIFTTTGNFTSFEAIQNHVHEKGGATLILIEEMNAAIHFEHSVIFYLTDRVQTCSTVPYEKSRTIFFFFIEAVSERYLSRKYGDIPQKPTQFPLPSAPEGQ